MEMENPEIASNDSFGKIIGVQTAILAVLLSVFTIFSHREHTNTLLFSNEASDTWAQYQAKRIREYQLEMNTDLVKLLAPNSTETAQTLNGYSEQIKKYSKELDDIKFDAENKQQDGEKAHHKAGFFDLAEGLLEIGVILSSLYFISHKKFFPLLGILLGGIGLFIGILGTLIH